MRGYPQVYRPLTRVRNFSIIEIQSMCENGTISARSNPERRRMKQVLKANIEVQLNYVKNAPMHLKAAHLSVAEKLKKYNNLIKAN
jgi:hypothetical protein